MPVVDAKFGIERLAAVYDALEAERHDLDAYEALVQEQRARRVVDLGCGTGVLALRLAARGVEVTGVDPAAASVEVARRKPGAERVHWVVGDATAIPGTGADLVVMTGNAAQAVTDDVEWARTLDAVHRALRPGGSFAFETRDPGRRAWTAWAADVGRRRRVDAGAAGVVETWSTSVVSDPPFVEFQESVLFLADGARLESRSRLRFRERGEVEDDLARAGFHDVEVRDAPDRPGLELVLLARV